MSLTNYDFVEVKLIEPTHSGLFARVDLVRGSFLGCFDGRAKLFPNVVQLASTTLGDMLHKDIFQLDQHNGVLLGLEPVDPFGGIDFANHSCRPNCELVKGIILVTNKDVARGEELTFDYRITDKVPEGIRCNCLMPNCII